MPVRGEPEQLLVGTPGRLHDLLGGLSREDQEQQLHDEWEQLQRESEQHAELPAGDDAVPGSIQSSVSSTAGLMSPARPPLSQAQSCGAIAPTGAVRGHDSVLVRVDSSRRPRGRKRSRGRRRREQRQDEHSRSVSPAASGGGKRPKRGDERGDFATRHTWFSDNFERRVSHERLGHVSSAPSSTRRSWEWGEPKYSRRDRQPGHENFAHVIQVEQMLERRNELRRHRDYAGADALLAKLKEELNVYVFDKQRLWGVGGVHFHNASTAKTSGANVLAEAHRTSEYQHPALATQPQETVASSQVVAPQSSMAAPVEQASRTASNEQKTLDAELLAATHAGDLTRARAARAAGASLTGARTAGSSTCFQLAAFEGHTELVRYFLAEGADIGARRTKGGATALILAAQNGHIAVVTLLLDASKVGTVDIANHNGSTALIMAATNGHADTVQLLLKRGADIRATSLKGTTALIAAASGGHVAVVRQLLLAGADREARDNRGKTALLSAQQHSHAKTEALLRLSASEFHQQENHKASNTTARTESSHAGSTEQPASLSPDESNSSTRSSGDPALAAGSVTKKGREAPTSSSQPASTTLIHDSGWSNLRFSQLWQLLVAFGLPTDGPKDLLEARLALHLAENAMAKQSSRSPTVTSRRRQAAATAAGSSTFSNRHGSFEPDRSDTLQHDSTAAGATHAGSENEDEDDCKVIAEETVEQRNAKARTLAIDLEDAYFLSDLVTACKAGDTARIIEALEGGVSIDGADADGVTGLMAAAESSQPRAVRVLLQQNAQLDLIDRDGWSAVMYAAKANSAPCVTLLANAGANLEIVDREFGTTAFLIACEHGCASSVSALAAAGANVSAVDKDGSTGQNLAAGERPPHHHVLKLLQSCVCDVCGGICARASVLLPNDNMLCTGCFEAQKQGPPEERELCRAANRCAGGRVLLDGSGQPLLAPWDRASPSPRQNPQGATEDSSSATKGANPVSHVPHAAPDIARCHAVQAGSLETLLDNLEELERGLWPPKRPRSSFIYFAAASKAAIQAQVQEEEQKKGEEEKDQNGHMEYSDNASLPDQEGSAGSTGGSRRRKKSRFSQLLSLSWRNLDAEERKVYEKLAAADHARFEREREIWARSQQEISAMRQQRMWEEAQEAQTAQSGRVWNAGGSAARARAEPSRTAADTRTIVATSAATATTDVATDSTGAAASIAEPAWPSIVKRESDR